MSDSPLFHILNESENTDGTVDVKIEITDELITYYKLMTGKKRATRKGIQKFLSKLIEDAPRPQRLHVSCVHPSSD